MAKPRNTGWQEDFLNRRTGAMIPTMQTGRSDTPRNSLAISFPLVVICRGAAPRRRSGGISRLTDVEGKPQPEGTMIVGPRR